MCDFKRHAIPEDMATDKALMAQLEYALGEADLQDGNGWQLDLLTLGSFLHDVEVSPEFRAQSFMRLAQIPELKKIVIESRAPYIKEDVLKELRQFLRTDQILEIGLGVESSDEYVRNTMLNKSLLGSDITKTIDTCVASGTEFLAYLLIGSMGLSEEQAIDDAVKSAKYIHELCEARTLKFRIAFEPIFITQNTVLEEMYEKGEYQLVNLWSVAEVVKRTSGFANIFVGLSDENLSKERVSSGCNKCTDTLRAALEQFNGSQNLMDIREIACDCHPLARR
tara:strand:+ start:6005 stop:6847 length:843 start_codon:yes stop_codon:yes gene_type:complete